MSSKRRTTASPDASDVSARVARPRSRRSARVSAVAEGSVAGLAGAESKNDKKLVSGGSRAPPGGYWLKGPAMIDVLRDAARTVVPERGDRHGPLPPLLLVLTVVTGLVDAVSYLALGH